MRCMNLSYQEFREARQQGKDGFELFEPLIEKPKGVEINLDGYTAIMKDWEVIATAGGQFDPE